MAHQIEGNRMMYVGETPWHQLGVRLENPPTTAEAMVAAGMDWEVGTKDLFLGAEDGGEKVSHKATVRLSDGKVLGVVGPGWHPLQNKDAFAWFDPFLQAGQANLETAGVLKGGKRVWVLAKLNRDPMVIVPGDEVEKYVLLANSHDGSLAVRVGFTPIRVVCNNTLSASLSSDASKLLKVRHTKGVKDVIEVVRDTMNLADAAFEATAEQYRFLASKKVSAGDLEKYVKLVFPKQKSRAAAQESAPELQAANESDDFARLMGQNVQDRTDDAEKEQRGYVGKITELFERPRGGVIPAAEGSYWQAYNAVTEFTTHERGRSDENRLNAMFNDGMAINRRALQVASVLAGA